VETAAVERKGWRGSYQERVRGHVDRSREDFLVGYVKDHILEPVEVLVVGGGRAAGYHAVSRQQCLLLITPLSNRPFGAQELSFEQSEV
jgi:hypothetical protein